MKFVIALIMFLSGGEASAHSPFIQNSIVEESVAISLEVGEPIWAFKDIRVCSNSSAKTYMDYQKISKTSRQGKFIAENMTIKDGLLYDQDGFIGVALGSYFGAIGTRFIFTLDTGIELKVVKVETKSDAHTINGCKQRWDGSVIEFVIDLATHKFPYFSNKYIANGNFNNLEQFKGNIVRIRKEY